MQDVLSTLIKALGAYLIIFPLKRYFKDFVGNIPDDLTFKQLLKYHFPRSFIARRRVCNWRKDLRKQNIK
jgi:hypothetical protein